MASPLLTNIDVELDRLRYFEDYLSGYHRASLEEPYRLERISQNLCDLLGYTCEEIQQCFGEDYSLLVYEDDRAEFLRFCEALAEREQTLTQRYRMKKKDGTLLTVCDTSTSCRLEDGKMHSFSIISDISNWPENRPLGDLISSLLPYGFLQCTCEKYPKITYINRYLSQYLNIGSATDAWIQNAWENVFFMLPFEERDRFQSYLEQAQQSDHPIQIEHYVFRNDGTRAHLHGWMSLIPASNGKKEYAILYRQIDDNQDVVEPIQATSYFPVLKRAYDAIFKFDLATSMVECIHGLENTPIGSLFGVQMTIASAKYVFLENYIYSEDAAMMAAFLSQICDPEDNWNGRNAMQVEFQLKSSQRMLRYLAVAVRLYKHQLLLCCRDITDPIYSSSQALESQTLHMLYDWMDYLSMNAVKENLGMLMLDKRPEGCSLIYGSASVLHYLGLDAKDSPHRTTRPTLMECLKAADITLKDFQDLTQGKPLYLWSRSAPDAYQFQLTCNTYVREDRTLYVLWCNKNFLNDDASSSKNKVVFARTFGHFDLFVGNTPITFSSPKEKELMALLIDRNGGTLTPSDAISYLWENEPVDEHTSARYRKLALGLKRTLEKFGISHIILNQNGIRSIDKSAIRCDYYELLAGNEKYRQAFHNVYMSDYSWGEDTLATLWNYS